MPNRLIRNSPLAGLLRDVAGRLLPELERVFVNVGQPVCKRDQVCPAGIGTRGDVSRAGDTTCRGGHMIQVGRLAQ